MRQPRAADGEAGDVDGEKARGVQRARGAEGQQHQADGGDGIETGARQRQSAERGPAGEAHRQPDGQTYQQLVDDQRGHLPAAAPLPAGRAGEGHQHDVRGVVEARLRLQNRPEAARQGQPAQHGEDRCGVGRGHGCGQQQGDARRNAEHQDGKARDHQHADEHADCGQHRGDRKGRPHPSPAGGQPTLGEDHRQRDQPELRGQLVSRQLRVEGLPDHQPDGKVDQQRRHTRAAGHPDRQDRDEQQRAADQHHKIGAEVHHLHPGRMCG